MESGRRLGHREWRGLEVEGAAGDVLNQRRGTAEKTFRVRVEYGDKSNFGKVEAFSQNIDGSIVDVEVPLRKSRRIL